MSGVCLVFAIVAGVSDKTGPTSLHAIGSNKQTRETKPKTWSLKLAKPHSDSLEILSYYYSLSNSYMYEQTNLMN